MGQTTQQNTVQSGLDTLVDQFENFAGSDERDTVHGNALPNTIVANNQDDTVYGGAGNDKLFGSENSDRLFGEAGDDQLNGGNSPSGDNHDTCDGGTGSHDVPFFCEQKTGFP
jgi:Ca2+-binding RTX toxin-like protein